MNTSFYNFRIVSVVASLIIGVGVTMDCASASDTGQHWSMFGNGPNHMGYQPGISGENPPVELWATEILHHGGMLNQVVVADNRVFLTPNDLGEEFLVALDSNSGDEVWRFDFGQAFSIGPPSYADNSVLVQKIAGRDDSALWSFDASNGSVNWSAPFSIQAGRYYSPVVGEGSVWIGGGLHSGLYGFDLASGEQQFQNEDLDFVDEWTPLYHQSRLYSWVAGVFREHDATSGEALRAVRLSDYSSSDQYAIAVAEGGLALIQDNTALFAVELGDFSVRWQVPVEKRGTPAVFGGRVYVVEDFSIRQFDSQTGENLGDFTSEEVLHGYSQPIVTDNRLIVSTVSQVLILDSTSMEIVHTIPATGLLSLANGNLYIAGAGKVSAWKLSYRDRQIDLPPEITNPASSVEVNKGQSNLSFDLRGLFKDPDDPDDAIYLTIDSNTNPGLVAAKIVDKRLMMEFGNFVGEAELTIRANSYGQITRKTVLISVVDPDIAIELYDAAGKRVEPGDTVSGIITGRSVISNKLGQHAQFYQNFRVLHVHGHGHMIDSDHWVRTFSVDTREFYDGENLISLHVHPHNMPGQPYLATFDVGSIKVTTANSNPAPNGDRELPTMRIDHDSILPFQASRLPGSILGMFRDAVTVHDDFGEIDIEHERDFSRQAQVIAHLGASVLGRFRWEDQLPPWGDSVGKVFEDVSLINFQREFPFRATIVFFFNDAAGRANYGFHTFTMPALAPEDRSRYPLPALDAEILNLSQGDEIVIPDGGAHTIKVKVSNPAPLIDKFSHLSTWVGNRSVAITDLEPYLEKLNPGENSFTVDVEIPAEEIRKIQDSRMGGRDSAAFAVWNDFVLSNRTSLPVSEHVHLSMIRTEDHHWPYGPPSVSIQAPVTGSILTGNVIVSLLVSGDFTDVGGLFVQLGNQSPVRVENFEGQQGLLEYEISGLARESHQLKVFFVDLAGEPLDGEESIGQVTFQLINDPPTAVVDTYKVGESESLTVGIERGLLVNDLDRERDPLIVSEILRAPTNGEFNWFPDGAFTYTPDSGFVGMDELYYVVNDGFDNSSPAMAVFSVAPVNSVGIPGGWQQFGNDPSHSGFQAGYAGDYVPNLLWKTRVVSGDDGIFPVAVADGQVFVAPRSRVDGSFLVALDSGLGIERWRHDFDRAGSLNPPSHDGGSVYIQRGNHNNDSQLWSIDSRSGSVRWSSPFGAQWDSYYAPTVIDGKVFAVGGYNPGILGFDQETGIQYLDSGSISSRGDWTPLYHQGKLYSWVLGFFREHSNLTGEVVRTLEIGVSPFGGNQDIVAVAGNGIAYFQSDTTLTAVDLKDFAIMWQAPVNQRGTPSVSHGLVYTIEGHRILQLDALSGTYLGSFEAPQEFIRFTQPVLTNDLLLVSTSSKIYLIDRFTMALVNTIDDAGLLSLAQNTLFVAGDNTVSAWQIASGQQEPDEDSEAAIYNLANAELTLPLVRIESRGGEVDAPIISFAANVKMQHAPECDDLTFTVTEAEDATAEQHHFLQGNTGDAVSSFSEYTGLLTIPRINVVEKSDGPLLDMGYRSVRSEAVVSCSGPSFTIYSAAPAPR